MGDGAGFVRAGIFGARPQETAEAILLAAGDDVHMQVGHTLTDAIVDDDEGAFGMHSIDYGARKGAGSGE